jgi:hypothetical protein
MRSGVTARLYHATHGARVSDPDSNREGHKEHEGMEPAVGPVFA